jgi:glycosyltransferase involved in cell wall biosynthesis
VFDSLDSQLDQLCRLQHDFLLGFPSALRPKAETVRARDENRTRPRVVCTSPRERSRKFRVIKSEIWYSEQIGANRQMTKSESVNRKRHCMVVHAHYPYAETRVERQAQALLANGIEVDVICLGGSSQPAQATIDGVQVYRLPVQRNKGVSFVVQLFEYLAFFVLAFICLSKLHLRWHYSVVQVHNLPDFLVFVALIPKLTGASIILDLHDLMPEFYAERIQRSMNSLPVRLLRWQEYLSCRFANHVITVTELWRQSLIERGQPADRVSVVMNLADDRVFNRDTVAAMSTDNDCNRKQRTVVFVSSIMGLWTIGMVWTWHWRP